MADEPAQKVPYRTFQGGNEVPPGHIADQVAMTPSDGPKTVQEIYAEQSARANYQTPDGGEWSPHGDPMNDIAQAVVESNNGQSPLPTPGTHQLPIPGSDDDDDQTTQSGDKTNEAPPAPEAPKTAAKTAPAPPAPRGKK